MTHVNSFKSSKRPGCRRKLTVFLRNFSYHFGSRKSKRLVMKYVDHTFTTWSDVNRRMIRACPFSSGKGSSHTSCQANVQPRPPAEIPKGSFASFTVDLQN